MTDLSNKTRMHQFALVPLREGERPRFSQGTSVTCKHKVGQLSAVTDGRRYQAVEDSFFAAPDGHRAEYVMVTNDRGDWGIYLAERFE